MKTQGVKMVAKTLGLSLGMGALGVAVLSGCFGSEPEPQRVSIAQACSAPKYTITMGKLTTAEVNTLAKSEFKAILEEGLRGSNCFTIAPKASEGSYVLDVEYRFKIDETKEETSMVSSKDSAMLSSDVKFTLKAAKNTITQNATSTLKLSGQKYLGLGEEVNVSQAQKEDLVKKSLNTIFTNLSSMK